jgi:hypothetical protein
LLEAMRCSRRFRLVTTLLNDDTATPTDAAAVLPLREVVKSMW